MKNLNLVSYKEYIIDTELQTYKAVWNCQVEWTDECIYYDAETGRVEIGEDEVDFVSEHQHRVTKAEYQEHVKEAAQFPAVSEDELKQRIQYKRELA